MRRGVVGVKFQVEWFTSASSQIIELGWISVPVLVFVPRSGVVV
jgi:hypothetical protein